MLNLVNRGIAAVGNACRNLVGKVANRYTATGAGLTVASTGAMAQTDYSVITSAVDWAPVVAIILAIFASAAVVLVAMKGGFWGLGAIKRA
ncbi:MAG: hypothetical protein NXI11_00890 [Proteobacteria bacterium]|nr:hypothetical protein [Pseudomonadota bacterium]